MCKFSVTALISCGYSLRIQNFALCMRKSYVFWKALLLGRFVCTIVLSIIAMNVHAKYGLSILTLLGLVCTCVLHYEHVNRSVNL